MPLPRAKRGVSSNFDVAKRLDDSPNEILHVAITIAIFKFDVSRKLIDGGSSFDIMYSYLLGIPYAAMLDVVASFIHLKLKNHTVHDELAIINIDLSVAKWIYKALQKDKKKGDANFEHVTPHTRVGEFLGFWKKIDLKQYYFLNQSLKTILKKMFK